MPAFQNSLTRAQLEAELVSLQQDMLSGQNTAARMRRLLREVHRSFFNWQDDRITIDMLPAGIGYLPPGSAGGDFASLTGSPYDNTALANILNGFYRVINVPAAQALAEDFAVSAGAHYHILRGDEFGDVELFGIQGTGLGANYFSPVGFWQNPATGLFEFASYDVATNTVTPFGGAIDTSDIVLKSNSLQDNTLANGLSVQGPAGNTAVTDAGVAIAGADGSDSSLQSDRLNINAADGTSVTLRGDRLLMGNSTYLYDANANTLTLSGASFRLGYTPTLPTELDTVGARDAARALDEKLANKNQPNGYLGLDSGGLIDIARIPALPAGRRIVSSGGLADLTSSQQTQIGQGTIVTTTDGYRWSYSGTGSKTDAASYVQIADITPVWNVIEGKPTWGTGLVYDVPSNTYSLDFASTSDETTGTATQKVSTPAGRTSWWTAIKSAVQTIAAVWLFPNGFSLAGTAITGSFDPNIDPNGTLAQAVVNGMGSDGVFPGTQPTGSTVGQRFRFGTATYWCFRGTAGTPEWIRVPKG